MKELPIYYFFIVNRDRQVKLRYSGLFVPRVGDTIEIGGLYLKVVDVIVESAQGDGEGIQHALYVHVEEGKRSLAASDYEELEPNEFCDQMKKNPSRIR